MVARHVASKPTSVLEKSLKKEGYLYIAGIDEAGMSPLAGPVVAAAVIFNGHRRIKNINDSKKLSAELREELYYKIFEQAVAVGVGIGSVEQIEEDNIYWASRSAMLSAVSSLETNPDYLLIDGNKPLRVDIPQRSIVKGDGKCFCIAAASIIAKVTRDRIMADLHEQYPDYGWAQNKGYPTKFHREMIEKHGVTPVHRKLFKGVREWI